MLVREIMTPDVEGIDVNATVLEASKKMRAMNVGALPVFEQGRPAGMITDRDIIVRSISEEMNPARMSVGEVMSRRILSCDADSPVQRAAELMEEYQVRRLLVRDSLDQIVGVVSLGDLAVRSDRQLSAEALRRISEGGGPRR